MFSFMQPSTFSYESCCETASSPRDKSQGRGMEILLQRVGFFLILQQLQSLLLNCVARSSAGKRCLLREELIPSTFPLSLSQMGLSQSSLPNCKDVLENVLHLI